MPRKRTCRQRKAGNLAPAQRGKVDGLGGTKGPAFPCAKKERKDVAGGEHSCNVGQKGVSFPEHTRRNEVAGTRAYMQGILPRPRDCLRRGAAGSVKKKGGGNHRGRSGLTSGKSQRKKHFPKRGEQDLHVGGIRATASGAVFTGQKPPRKVPEGGGLKACTPSSEKGRKNSICEGDMFLSMCRKEKFISLASKRRSSATTRLRS